VGGGVGLWGFWNSPPVCSGRESATLFWDLNKILRFRGNFLTTVTDKLFLNWRNFKVAQFFSLFLPHEKFFLQGSPPPHPNPPRRCFGGSHPQGGGGVQPALPIKIMRVVCIYCVEKFLFIMDLLIPNFWELSRI